MRKENSGLAKAVGHSIGAIAEAIGRYIEAEKPKTLDEAEHMLDLISVIADETIREIEAEPPYGLSAEALAKFDERIATLAEAIAR